MLIPRLLPPAAAAARLYHPAQTPVFTLPRPNVGINTVCFALPDPSSTSFHYHLVLGPEAIAHALAARALDGSGKDLAHGLFDLGEGVDETGNESEEDGGDREESHRRIEEDQAGNGERKLVEGADHTNNC